MQVDGNVRQHRRAIEGPKLADPQHRIHRAGPQGERCQSADSQHDAVPGEHVAEHPQGRQAGEEVTESERTEHECGRAHILQPMAGHRYRRAAWTSPVVDRPVTYGTVKAVPPHSARTAVSGSAPAS